MSRVDSTGSSRPLLQLWPLVFGFVVGLDRLLVLIVWGVRPLGGADFAGLALALVGEIGIGFALVILLVALRRTRLRFLAYGLVWCVVVLDVAAFHYEAVFRRLPGISMLYYLREATSLSSSVAAHAPLGIVMLEVIVCAAILTIVAERLRARPGRIADEDGGRIPWIAVFDAACLAFAILTHFVISPSLPRDMTWRSRVPILWAIKGWTFSEANAAVASDMRRASVIRYQQEIGQRVPLGTDDRYVLCGNGPRFPGRTGNGRSVIFLILESVGRKEMELKVGGQPVMPSLQRIAKDSLSFREIKASGTKSIQAMPAFFAGIPPQSAMNMLWREPLNNVEGMPLLLRRHGYDTVYFHGGDLSFEQQRQFLRMVGFEKLFELDYKEGHPFSGWGFFDDVEFAKLTSWIASRRAKRPQAPYLATLFTLTTHDPYVLPAGRKRVFPGSGMAADFTECLRYLDEQLGAFYDWYLRNEAPRGTILVITGDHAPHLSGDKRIDADEVGRFDVPLVIHGVARNHLRGVTEPAARRGAHFDIPATILGLLDLSPGRCDQGLDLLAPDSDWSRGRTLYSVSGDQLENFYIWYPDADIRLDLMTRRAYVRPLGGKRLSAEEVDRYEMRAFRFYTLENRISVYLTHQDRFAPPPVTVQIQRHPLPTVRRPFFAAHRGQSRGELPNDEQNKAKTIETAIDDGFRWVEVDVNITADDVPVVIHDEEVTGVDGRKVAVRDLRLDQIRALPGLSDLMTLDQFADRFGKRVGLLIEIKPQHTISAHTMLLWRATRIVRNKVDHRRLIMDSFSPFIATSLKQHCDCSVGYDAPSGEASYSAWLDSVALTKLDWVYVRVTDASPKLIREAHAKGLRVLVYTVDSMSQIENLRGEWPDAVITDTADLVREFDRSVGSPPSGHEAAAESGSDDHSARRADSIRSTCRESGSALHEG